MRKSLVVLILILVFSCFVFSEETDRQDLNLNSNESTIEIRSTRLVEQTNSQTLIEEEEIEESTVYSALDLVMQRTPGLYLTRKSIMGYGVAGGSAGKITLRGLGGSPTTQVLVLVNGRPNYMGMMGHPLPDAYNLYDARQIEVTRGPASVRYGSYAMGGAINIITGEEIDPGIHFKLKSAYGSYNTEDYIFTTTGNYSPVSWSVSGGYRATDGHRDNDNFHSDNYSGWFKFKSGDHWTASLDFYNNHFKYYNPGPATAPLTGAWYDITRSGYSFDVKHIFSKYNGTLSISTNLGDHAIYDGWRSDDSSLTVSMRENLKITSGIVMMINGSWNRFGGAGENIKAKKDFGEYFLEEGSGAIEFNIKPFSKILINPGYRYTNNSLFGGVGVFKLGTKIFLTKQINLIAEFSQGYRNPTIRELYLFPAPNPELKPETCDSYSFGLMGMVLDENLTYEISVYRMLGDNLISITGKWPNLEYKNSGEFEHDGFEADLSYTPVRNLEFWFAYSYLDPGDNTASNPLNSFKYGTGWTWRRFNLNLNVETIKGLYAGNKKTEKMDDYSVLNLYAGYSLNESIKIFVSGNNLLNSEYQAMKGYPMPGTTGMLGLSWRY